MSKTVRRVIYLSGRAGSGKTIASNYLREYCAFTPIAFADPLKDALCCMTGVERTWFDDPSLKNARLPEPWNKWTPRCLMQRFGTECVRDVLDKNFWVKRARVAFQKLGCPAKVLFTDVRYANETRVLPYTANQIVLRLRIDRRKAPRLPGKHSSELGVPVDWVLLNNCGLSCFYDRLHTIVVPMDYYESQRDYDCYLRDLSRSRPSVIKKA